ncbi:X-ray radiation resistance-associated protein 1 [Irineochytrium annulatum]|nr:X-ray radiation resistance-associated protein 1 [Irineochytrium annulatum]
MATAPPSRPSSVLHLIPPEESESKPLSNALAFVNKPKVPRYMLPPLRKPPALGSAPAAAAYKHPGKRPVKPKEYNIVDAAIVEPELDKGANDTAHVEHGVEPIWSPVFVGRKPMVTRRQRLQKYSEVPHLLDGFFILNKAPADDPDDVYLLDVSNHNLRFVIEDDLSLFTKLHTMRAGENLLPMAKLGALPNLKSLSIPFNDIKDLDLEVEGKFAGLERLELTSCKIKSLPETWRDMARWRDKVIECLIPTQVALLDAMAASQNVTAVEGHFENTLNTFIPSEVQNPSPVMEHESDVAEPPQRPSTGANPPRSLSVELKAADVSESSKVVTESTTVVHNEVAGNATVEGLPDSLIGAVDIIESVPLPHTEVSAVEASTGAPAAATRNATAAAAEPSFGLNNIPTVVRKYPGFKLLEELNVSKNLVSTPAGLMGLVWLPSLRKLHLGGNPIVRRGGGMIGISDKTEHGPVDVEKDVIGFLKFDPIEILPRVYNIEIADLELLPIPPVLEDTYYALLPQPDVVGPTVKKVRRQIKTLPLPSKILRRPPGLSISFIHDANTIHPQLPHCVEPVQENPTTKMRRDFAMTDEDVKAMIKAGRVLTLKELKLERKRREVEEQIERVRTEKMNALQEAIERGRHDAEEAGRKLWLSRQIDREEGDSEMGPLGASGDQAELAGAAGAERPLASTDAASTTVSSSEEQLSDSKKEMKYNPDAVDKTFLTSVHITGSPLADDDESAAVDSYDDGDNGFRSEDEKLTDDGFEGAEDEEGEDERNNPMEETYESEHDFREDRNNVFPASIQASIRALRHALWNPASYWRIIEDSYAKSTFASTKRFAKANLREKKAEETGAYDQYAEALDSAGSREGDATAASTLAANSGFVSPVNTMWTTYAAQAALEHEAEMQSARNEVKSMANQGYKVMGNNKGPKNAAGQLPADPVHDGKAGYGERGVFGEDQAKEVALKLSTELLQKTLHRNGNGSPNPSEGSSAAHGERQKSAPTPPPAPPTTGPSAAMVTDAMTLAEQRVREYRKKAAMNPKGNKRAMNDFDALNAMMTRVDQKLSSRLYDEVKTEYVRIESLYASAATKAIKGAETK